MQGAELGEKRTPQNRRTYRKSGGLWIQGRMDYTFLFLVLGLLIVGLVMLFSVSAPFAANRYGNSYHYITRQLVFAALGVVFMLIISKINYKILKKFAWPIAVISVGLLAVALILPIFVATERDDFRRWINLGFFQFQPSEIAKFAIVVLLAYLIAKNPGKMKEIKFQITLLAIIATFCGLIIAAPHLSATIIVFSIGIVIMFIGGMDLKLLVSMGVVGVAGVAVAALSGILDHAANRIAYWQNPWLDPRGSGYQTIQSLLAVASGGIMGQGIGQSNQKYLWLPEPQNDFIFSIVTEELGFIGASLIIVAFALLTWRGFVIALRAPDKFGMLLGVGLVFQVGLQTVLNILVVTNAVPNTGISLPFFSYGGTALLMLMCQMGVVLSISRTTDMQKA